MAKKRKSDSTGLDEVDRSMYTSFCSTANSLSQLYTQSMNQQRLSFQAGERHSLEKLDDWISRQQEDGSRVNTVDIVTYLQKELDYGSEEPATPPRVPFQCQIALHSTDGGFPVPSSCSSSFAPTTHGQGLRSGHSDHQAKNSVFSNALSSPVRWSLQQYPLSQGGVCSSNPCLNDSFMDIHDDIPGQEH